jgi:hypothetical protein
MIYEYALEPEMVATWGTRSNYRLYLRAFGLGQGRIVSRYPESWVEIVKNLILNGNRKELEKKRLVELLNQLKETIVQRKDCCWNDERGCWLENALHEHKRYPFFAIMARNNPEARPEIITEDSLLESGLEKWEVPHGRVVNRKAPEMAAAVEMMLSRCRQVKFIDPHLSPDKPSYRNSLKTFLNILRNDRPVGLPEVVEIHTNDINGASSDYLKKEFETLIPSGLLVTLFRWKEKPGGQKLHNRFILTDIGGVSFHHGLDTGDGEDDINRLDQKQYLIHLEQYKSNSSAFDQAESPLQITGTRKI